MGGESWPPQMECRMKRGDVEGSNKASCCSTGRERKSFHLYTRIHELMQCTSTICTVPWMTRGCCELDVAVGSTVSLRNGYEGRRDHQSGPTASDRISAMFAGGGEQIRRANFSFFITEHSMVLRPSSSKWTIAAIQRVELSARVPASCQSEGRSGDGM